MADDRCIDNYNIAAGTKIMAFGCHGAGGNQFIAFTKIGLLMTMSEDFCIGVSSAVDTTALHPVVVDRSEADEKQQWRYDSKVRNAHFTGEKMEFISITDKVCYAL